MHVPKPIVAVGILALLLAGVVVVFLLLAAVRIFFAFIELFAALLIVGGGAYLVWKLFFAGDGQRAGSP